MRRIVCVFASLLTLAACASEPRRLPSNVDPSSPDAPEAPPASLPSTLSAPVASAPPAPEQGHAGHGGAQASPDASTSASGHAHHGAPATATSPDAGTATVYTCPMHPEVRSEQPGRCPKCGMKLVPEEKSSAPSGHDHGAHP
ncbi:hypothetical protein JY651_34135 [Pyxidicoccus parkwayensis]|uniref:Heavy metal binding domain-containing protein n=1 Tax=Pyxidicoccus parkwayensis TaxID=2813578 RepID=A0ABX7PDX5_9BACT|nr:heavy metal-binding domain-containing protein [Pyxidicoccus parkwaysis]QSQ28626.1 hypothetical protein JY651_34135 [Pyxidicoccus parkwaysis]